MGAREAASAPNAYRIARMCRLFGFRSNIPARVHEDLVCEKNSLRAQSVEHKDGWGIASYVDSALPEVAHGVGPAHLDPEFERVSNLLSSRAVIAHVRLASEARVDPDFRALFRGETDSERCFYLFLTLLRRRGGLESPPLEDVARALAAM